ncbi:inositol monophosphatase family protein [Micromonospora siamensis]|uniref:Myo-inositol-1(Or 4)-monophosphatase n=1 Tax=Micromonospora siamensis TaxID=299152 RepID=A0A1C5K474_9ACTN|nr:inositol monophosphatase family protein [Micromonospora siamensis]SCG77339.1 myo-inositol-1(or 4)-monophosphatase [Micromonospora siamensis]
MSIPDSELAVAAASAGAHVVRVRYGTVLARFDKSPTDFATAADIEAEQAILDVLRTARPDDAVLAEESGRTGGTDAARTWLVDPLCGTLNFAARTQLVAVNVALRTGSHVSAAAMADPFTDEVFWTDGARASVRHAGTDEPLAPTGESRLVDVNLDPPFPNASAFRAARLLADDRFVARFGPRVLSTTLALTWVAAGRRAAYLTDGAVADSVHFAAGIALCRAAGCVVTDLRGAPLAAGPVGLLVAADEQTHAELLALVRDQLTG